MKRVLLTGLRSVLKPSSEIGGSSPIRSCIATGLPGSGPGRVIVAVRDHHLPTASTPVCGSLGEILVRKALAERAFGELPHTGLGHLVDEHHLIGNPPAREMRP